MTWILINKTVLRMIERDMRSIFLCIENHWLYRGFRIAFSMVVKMPPIRIKLQEYDSKLQVYDSKLQEYESKLQECDWKWRECDEKLQEGEATLAEHASRLKG